MTTLLIVLAAIVVIVVLVAAARLKRAGLSISGVSEAPIAPAAAYELAESLFSPAERSSFEPEPSWRMSGTAFVHRPSQWAETALRSVSSVSELCAAC